MSAISYIKESVNFLFFPDLHYDWSTLASLAPLLNLHSHLYTNLSESRCKIGRERKAEIGAPNKNPKTDRSR